MVFSSERKAAARLLQHFRVSFTLVGGKRRVVRVISPSA